MSGTLHIVQTPYKAAKALASTQAEDSIIFIADAVNTLLTITTSHNQCFALLPDCAARGITLPKNISLIDYTQMAALACQHKNSITW